jgi:cobalt transporter subunit CbtA
MFKNMIVSAFGAAVLVGLVISVLQAFTIEPLILEAERYENVGAGHEPVGVSETARDSQSDGAGQPDSQQAWSPGAGLERSFYSLLGNVVVAFAVALMLLGGMAFAGAGIDPVRGLAWGGAGFAAFSLLPSLGLPPELPGTAAASIEARQIWWLMTAIASAVGLGLLTLARNWFARAAGLVLLLAPHLIGAPLPPHHDVPYPGALAGEFAIASMAVSVVLWGLAGLSAGWLHAWLAKPADAATARSR